MALRDAALGMTHSRMVTRPARTTIAACRRRLARPDRSSRLRFRQKYGYPRSSAEEISVWSRQYGADVLAAGRQQGRRRAGQREGPKVEAERGLVVEGSEGRVCGAGVGYQKGAGPLQDRHGQRRVFPPA